MKKAGKQLLYQRLYELGLAESLKEAQALMMAGKVLVNDQPARAGMRVGPDDAIRIKGVQMPYLAKGGLKLAGALAAFDESPIGQVCLDAGCFCRALLRTADQRAGKVYAVGCGVLPAAGQPPAAPPGVNLGALTTCRARTLSLSPRPSFATCDLSYLSLREAVPIYRAILHGSGTLLCLVKPLFEVDDALARRTGEIADSAYAPLLRDMARCLNALEGTRVMDVCASPVTGYNGTIEFFFHVVFGGEGTAPQLEDAILSSVSKVLQVKAQALENADV